MFPPRPSRPSTGWHHLRIGWEALYSPFPWEGLTLVFHFPPCLVNEAGEALEFQKIGSTRKRLRASFVRREGSGEAQGSQRCFINLESEWSAGPQSFGKSKICKMVKPKIAESWATAELCQGRELDHELCCFSGSKERNQQGNLHRGCAEETPPIWTADWLHLQDEGFNSQLPIKWYVCVWAQKHTILPALMLTSLEFKHTLKFEN